jgi:hypothetical protein
MALLPTYPQFGGIYPATAGMTNLLAAHGVVAPHTGTPFSEPMIFGIGGGLGIGYILWEFQEHGSKVLVLAFQHRWQYPPEFFQNVADGLGVAVSMPETGSRKSAAHNLDKALAANRPALAWIDPAFMPYFQLPEAMQGHGGHFVVFCGKDDTRYWVDDVAQQPFEVDADTIADGRARVGSYKNRLLLVEQVPEDIDLPHAIQRGLTLCVDHLSSSSESFSLPAIQKWAKLMTDSKNKKGWHVVFKDRRGLFSTLRSMFEGIAVQGAPGGLRGMYADFLREAEPIVKNPKLSEVADLYTGLGEQWDALAEAALPDEVAVFKEVKYLLRERKEILLQGGKAWRDSIPLSHHLRTLSTASNLNFPMSDSEIATLFADLQGRLFAIYEGEQAAVQALGEAIA